MCRGGERKVEMTICTFVVVAGGIRAGTLLRSWGMGDGKKARIVNKTKQMKTNENKRKQTKTNENKGV
jgi:hypothetical protein